MTDLDRLLDSFGSPGGAPPPAAEIRRRGDRLRRRNRALQVGGGTLAVVLIATPLALLARDDERTAPVPPADRPAVVEPALRDLADGLPVGAGLTGEPAALDNATPLELCDAQVWSSRAPQASDLRAVSAELAGGDVERDLLLYANPELAGQSVTKLDQTGLEDCGGPRTTVVPVTPEITGADQAATYVVSGGPDPVEVVTVVRVGTAVVLDRWSPTTPFSDAEAATAVDGVQPLVDALAPYRTAGVTLDPAAVMADDRVLRAGDVPASRRTGAWTRDDDDGSPLTCQVGSLEDLGATTLLRTRFTTASGGEVRTATLELPDEATATEVRETTAGWIDGCDVGQETRFAIGEPLVLGEPFERPPVADLDLPRGTSVDTEPGGLGYGALFEVAGGEDAWVAVAQVGDRVVVVTQQLPRAASQDVTPLLRAAADRMAGLEP